MQQHNDSDKPILEKDVFINLLSKLWARRRLLVRNTLVGAVLGVAFALGVQKTYTSEIVLAPEMSSGTSVGGSLSSLASMAGINLGASSTDAIYPELYPDIIYSAPFVVGLFDVQVKSLDGEIDTSLYEYLLKHQTIAWWEYPKKLITGAMAYMVSLLVDDKFNKSSDKPDPFYLSKEQSKIADKIMMSVISATVNKKDQIITLDVTTQDPLVSATLADSVRVRLQEAITDYRTRKARHDMDYSYGLMQEAKADYKKAQAEYAHFCDTHHDVFLTSVKAEQDNLENELSMAYTIYSQAVQQYTMARAKVQERTPSFTIIQPSAVAIKPSSTPKLLVLFIWCFLAFAATSFYIILGDNMRGILAKFRNESPNK